MIEVELKCELRPELLSRLQHKLQQMRFVGTVHNLDVYYDTADYVFLRQAVFVRVRNQCKLEFKFNEHPELGHGQSTEHTFSLSPDEPLPPKANDLFAHFLPTWHTSSTLAEAISSNSLIELARIDNMRQDYEGDNIYLSLDQVANLGHFLEIETRAENHTGTSKAEARLQKFVADLDVQHIKVGYVELWLRKYNPAAYRLGRYQI